MALLEVTGITKKFGETEVLKGINFELDKGEVLTIIGSSGSGKTTLLRCLNYLETADTGKVVLDGEIIFDGNEKGKIKAEEIRRKRLNLGLVFQSFNLFPHYNVLKNVTVAPTMHAKEKLKTALGEFNAVSEEYASGAVSVATAISELTGVRNDLLLLKEDVIESSLPDGDRDRVGELTDVFFSAADSVISGAFSADEFEAVLRYAVCVMAYALR